MPQIKYAILGSWMSAIISIVGFIFLAGAGHQRLAEAERRIGENEKRIAINSEILIRVDENVKNIKERLHVVQP